MTATDHIIQQIDEQISETIRQIESAQGQAEAAGRRLGETWANVLSLLPGGSLEARPEKQTDLGKQVDGESKPAAPTDWLGELLSESEDGVTGSLPHASSDTPRPDTRANDEFWSQILEEEKAPFP